MSDNEKPHIHSDGWKQWSAQVKESLDKLEGKVGSLEGIIRKHREDYLVDITTLKVKAGVVGMIAGFITSTIMSVLVGMIVYQLSSDKNQNTNTSQKQPSSISQTHEITTGSYFISPDHKKGYIFYLDEEGDV